MLRTGIGADFVQQLGDERLMGEVGMVPIHRVFDGELPVAAVIVLVDSGPNLNVFGSRQADEQIQLPGRTAQMLLERYARGAETAEDEAPIARNPGYAGKSEITLVEVPAVGIWKWDAGQLAVKPKGPAVICAAKCSRVAPLLCAHGRGPMAASVEQQPHATVVIADHDDRLPADSLKDVVPGLRHLALMPDVDPSASEYSLNFIGEYLWIDVKARVDSIALDQRGVVVVFPSFHLSFLYPVERL